VAEKSREQWVRTVRRWLVVGAVVGFGSGTIAHFAFDGSSGLLGSLAFYLPMGAAMGLTLWASMYRYTFARVWGWAAMGLTFALIGLLLATSIGIGCLQGICGEP